MNHLRNMEIDDNVITHQQCVYIELSHDLVTCHILWVSPWQRQNNTNRHTQPNMCTVVTKNDQDYTLFEYSDLPHSITINTVWNLAISNSDLTAVAHRRKIAKYHSICVHEWFPHHDSADDDDDDSFCQITLKTAAAAQPQRLDGVFGPFTLCIRNTSRLFFFFPVLGRVGRRFIVFVVSQHAILSLSLDYLMISKILYNNGRPLSDRYLQLEILKIKLAADCLTHFPMK